MKRIEIIENTTGRILFTLIPSTEDQAVYIMDDGTGLLKGVCIYEIPVDYHQLRYTIPQ